MKVNKETITKDLFKNTTQCLFLPESIDEALFILEQLQGLDVKPRKRIDRRTLKEYMSSGIVVRQRAVYSGGQSSYYDETLCHSSQFETPYTSPEEKRIMAAFNALSARMDRLEEEVLPKSHIKLAAPKRGVSHGG